ncbi:MAG: Pre-mRNA-splicing factor cwc26 [Vezdaea aestivalis]|nr:MAG: Pre-mRNA-splicing factor cwc26 [Vezdaea aestivalis]
MSRAEYLAKNYLTADKSSSSRPKKKRKRNDLSAATTGLVIQDDDALGWDANPTSNPSDDDGPLIIGTAKPLRKTKTSNWKTVGVPPPSSSDQAAADAILRSAAAERNALAAAADDAPAILDTDSGPRMESGAMAGLQSAADVAAAVAAKRRAERAAFERDGDVKTGKGAETIYRDASGRVINVAMARAEVRAKEKEEEKKKREIEEAMRAPAQREQERKRKEDLKDIRFKPVARAQDDEEMNDELKERERWNDPAAGFVTKKKAGKSVSGKPLCKWPAAPNRYGIRPGYRWDGMDRGNGFEKKWFDARNRARERKQMEVQWEMDE